MTLNLTPITPGTLTLTGTATGSIAIGPVFTVTDGSTDVTQPGTLKFSGATVTESPTGTALVTVSGGSSSLLSVTVPVSSAEILALGTPTPKTMIAAPGAGKYIWPTRIFCNFHAGNVAYTATSNPEMIDWLGAGLEWLSPNLVPCFKSTVDYSLPWGGTGETGTNADLLGHLSVFTGGDPAAALALMVNKPLVLAVDAGNPGFAAGNGTATFIIEYRVIDTAL